jgi:hypothetical protein
MSKIVMFLFLGGLWGGVAEAQVNDRIDELLAQSPARLDSASYLVLCAAKSVSEDVSAAEAFSKAVALGIWSKGRKPTDGMTVQDLSYLLMKTLKVPGGLEWTFLPNPRAAYKELSYLSLINTSDGPERAVAGDEVVRTLGEVQAYRETKR